MPIIIDDVEGTAKVVTERIEKIVPLDEFFQEMSKGTPVVIPFLPKLCKGILTFSNYTGFIIEQKPVTLPISYRTHEGCGIFDGGHHDLTYNLHFPYVYWTIGVQNRPISIMGVGMCYAKQEVSLMTSELGWMVTPNILAGDEYEEPVGIVCFGDIEVRRNQNLEVCAEDCINAVMTSNFNQDHFNIGSGDGVRCPMIWNKQDFLDTSVLEKIKMEDPIYAEIQKEEEAGTIEGEERRKRYGKLSNEAMKAMFAQNDSRCKYLLAWEKLSQEMSLEEFVKEIEFPKKLTYEDLSNFTYKSLEKYDTRR